MSKALMELDHAAHAAYIDFGVEARGVGSAVEVSPEITVDLDPSGVAVGVELRSLTPESVPIDELCATAAFRAEDASLLRANLPAVLRFLAGGPETPGGSAARATDVVYLAS